MQWISHWQLWLVNFLLVLALNRRTIKVACCDIIEGHIHKIQILMLLNKSVTALHTNLKLKKVFSIDGVHDSILVWCSSIGLKRESLGLSCHGNLACSQVNLLHP
jgi:hypothetical protein